MTKVLDFRVLCMLPSFTSHHTMCHAVDKCQCDLAHASNLVTLDCLEVFVNAPFLFTVFCDVESYSNMPSFSVCKIIPCSALRLIGKTAYECASELWSELVVYSRCHIHIEIYQISIKLSTTKYSYGTA